MTFDILIKEFYSIKFGEMCPGIHLSMYFLIVKIVLYYLFIFTFIWDRLYHLSFAME